MGQSNERTIGVQFFSYSGGVALKGQTVELSDEDIARGDKYGAFEGQIPTTPDAVEAAFPPSDGGAAVGENAPPGAEPSGEAAEVGEPDPESGPLAPDSPNPPSVEGSTNAEANEAQAGNLTGEQIDALTGGDLDSAVAAAQIDASTGGSLKDGGMSADEKRAALHSRYGV